MGETLYVKSEDYEELKTEKKELEAELDKHRWIPVSEKLPEDDSQVWICYEKTGYTYNAYYDQNVLHFSQKTWQIFDYSGGYRKAEVNPTHWKPIILPKANQ